MANADECRAIARMSESELLDYVLDNTDYLTDRYCHGKERPK